MNAIDSKIVLIDGRQLAEYMIDLNVGVSVGENLRNQTRRFRLFH